MRRLKDSICERLRFCMRRLKYVPQMEVSDCGAACLAMVLKLYGRDVSLDELRNATGSGRDGVTAFGITRAAEGYALESLAIRLPNHKLDGLPSGTILHWSHNHFVVLERTRKASVWILDPALGRRAIPRCDAEKQFTGVAIVLRPGHGFVRHRQSAASGWVLLVRLLVHSLWGPILAASVAQQALPLALPVAIAILIDRILPQRNEDAIHVLVIGAIAIWVTFGIVGLVRASMLVQLGNSLDSRLFAGMMSHMVDLPYVFFQSRSVGDLMMRVSSNTIIRETITGAVLASLIDGVLALAYLAFILLEDRVLALIVLTFGVIEVGILICSWPLLVRLSAESIERETKSQTHLAQLLIGIQSLKALGAERQAYKRWAELFESQLVSQKRRGQLNAAVESVLLAMQMGAPLLVLVVGALRVSAGGLRLGTMLATVALTTAFVVPLKSLVSSGLKLAVLDHYLLRIIDVLQKGKEQDGIDVKPAPAISGQISVRNVSFRYYPAAPFVLESVSFELSAGSSLAVVGESGSGKSTLAALLVGLYLPTSGSVLYDSADLATTQLRTIRRQVAIMTQDPHLFPGTLRQNLSLLDPDVPLEAIEAACRLAGIHEEIARMPMGFESMLSDGGTSLSGGQRQRLALARCLVRNPAVLILDEATSALDGATEALVLDAVAHLRATKIVFAHRLSAVSRCDRIVVLKGGRQVETGYHAELLRRGGEYTRLMASQAVAATPAEI